MLSTTISEKSASIVLSSLDRWLPDLEALYKDLHAHPELSMQETRTAQVAADRLRKAGFEVTAGVGKTGVVGLLKNGAGPTVMLRADMDALPIEEATGLPYASKATTKDGAGKTLPVSHMCGHDMHVTWLAGAAALLAAERGAWHGTLMVVFQPGEETAQGARAMIDDDLFKRFPEARRGPRAAPDGRARRRCRRELGADHLRRGQSTDTPVRTGRARLDASGQHRPRRHGGVDGAAAPDHRLPGGRRHRIRRGHGGCVARWHEGERHPGRRHHQAERQDVRRRASANGYSPPSSGSPMRRPRRRARPESRRSRRSTNIRSM